MTPINFNEDESIAEMKTKNYEVKLMPFGVMFRESAPIFNGTESGTSASATLTAGLDTDTDPPDSD
ncbi:hypothetical protein [Bacillus thuringiensis]|uniref:hypothetical protein n=1 Tax=Bacillus thuringiensis TaxID=1428 RepID=UPI000BFA9B0E|nr:hypothetical protein [Bacillus thuringiensis]MCU5743740.1 hypothetical protein [Bacillus cereus]PFU61986.1 hypothetical protein COK85_10250 [Bacillus thuringiensis]